MFALLFLRKDFKRWLLALLLCFYRHRWVPIKILNTACKGGFEILRHLRWLSPEWNWILFEGSSMSHSIFNHHSWVGWIVIVQILWHHEVSRPIIEPVTYLSGLNNRLVSSILRGSCLSIVRRNYGMHGMQVIQSELWEVWRSVSLFNVLWVLEKATTHHHLLVLCPKARLLSEYGLVGYCGPLTSVIYLKLGIRVGKYFLNQKWCALFVQFRTDRNVVEEA